MGCDIHFHIEIKVEGVWHHYATPSIKRDYLFFSLLAGVRKSTDIHPISEPKGIPGDITTVTKLDLKGWEGDGHSHSWLSSNEIVLLEDRWEEMCKERGYSFLVHGDLEFGILRTFLFGNSFAGFKKYPADNPPELEDVRFIFWFDN